MPPVSNTVYGLDRTRPEAQCRLVFMKNPFSHGRPRSAGCSCSRLFASPRLLYCAVTRRNTRANVHTAERRCDQPVSSTIFLSPTAEVESGKKARAKHFSPFDPTRGQTGQTVSHGRHFQSEKLARCNNRSLSLSVHRSPKPKNTRPARR